MAAGDLDRARPARGRAGATSNWLSQTYQAQAAKARYLAQKLADERAAEARNCDGRQNRRAARRERGPRPRLRVVISAEAAPRGDRVRRRQRRRRPLPRVKPQPAGPKRSGRAGSGERAASRRRTRVRSIFPSPFEPAATTRRRRSTAALDRPGGRIARRRDAR